MSLAVMMTSNVPALACYTAQLGDVPGGWSWLLQACEIGNAATIKALAKEEPSLTVLWEQSFCAVSRKGPVEWTVGLQP